MSQNRAFSEQNRVILTWWYCVASCIVGIARCEVSNPDGIMAEGQADDVFGDGVMQPVDQGDGARNPRLRGLTMFDDDDSMYYKKNVIFESLDHVLNALTSMRNARFDQIQLLLDTFHKDCRVVYDDAKVTERYPFISIEGPEASGSAIVAKWLAFKLDAFNLTNPPECLMRVKNEFDVRHSALRKIYYALGVWVNSELAKKFSAQRPVIINRYWRSMTAYGVAMENRRTGLPLPHQSSRIYKYPHDLTIPDFNFYVNISETVRMERLAFRKQSMSSDLVKVINSVYSYFSNPSTLMLNGDRRVGDMLDEVASVLNITYIR